MQSALAAFHSWLLVVNVLIDAAERLYERSKRMSMSRIGFFFDIFFQNEGHGDYRDLHFPSDVVAYSESELDILRFLAFDVLPVADMDVIELAPDVEVVEERHPTFESKYVPVRYGIS